ncbi:MAG: hypothetical protein QOJ51_4753, partial [Acidobacteriaceae bacterium]|nr:hypothetical protein [Acidobacteriaceae bacterium]
QAEALIDRIADGLSPIRTEPHFLGITSGLAVTRPEPRNWRVPSPPALDQRPGD